MSSDIITQFSSGSYNYKVAYIVQLMLIEANNGSNSSWTSAMAAQLTHCLTYTTNIFAGDFVIIRNTMLFALAVDMTHLPQPCGFPKPEVA